MGGWVYGMIASVASACSGCPGDHREALPSAIADAGPEGDSARADAESASSDAAPASSHNVDMSENVARPKETGEGCPAGMARIKGGTFIAVPNFKAKMSPFCMHRTEVTLGSYAECVARGKCEKGSQGPECNWGMDGRESHPVNCVTYEQAQKYCKQLGARLPTDDEWAWAARGREAGTVYPWGNATPAKQLCWSGLEARISTCPVRSFPEGDSPDGVSDLSGNVWEWTSTRAHFGLDVYIIRGGSWNGTEAWRHKANAVNFLGADEPYKSTGFRCVASVKK
jgi:formylglycine-generating enzyme